MSAFRCPFCGEVSSDPRNQVHHLVNFHRYDVGDDPYLDITVFRCPNCEKETVIAEGVNGYCEDQTTRIYPRYSQELPDYIPEHIRKDYYEAASIIDLSSRASATLCRRCIEEMIIDKGWSRGDNLFQKIDNLPPEKVTYREKAAIDAVRDIGNIGAHFKVKSSEILDVSKDEAEVLLEMVEYLLRKWYIERHVDSEMLAALARRSPSYPYKDSGDDSAVGFSQSETASSSPSSDQ